MKACSFACAFILFLLTSNTWGQSAGPAYTHQEYTAMLFCVGLTDTAWTNAQQKLNGVSLDAAKKRYDGRLDDKSRELVFQIVDKVYTDSFTNAWDYGLSFFGECAQNVANVGKDRSGVAKYCMQSSMTGSIAWEYKNEGKPKDTAYQELAKLGDAGRSIIDRVYAESEPRAEVGTGEWVSCMQQHASAPAPAPAQAADQPAPAYGPLTFNREGADFYVVQDGKFAPAAVSGGTIEIRLHSGSFQIGYNGEQMNICLAQTAFPEVRADSSGNRVSCLSGAESGAREPNSDALLVYSGQKWSDGNSELSDETSMKAAPMKGFRFAYQINQLYFVGASDRSLSSFKGTLYGYIVVYKQHERSNKDIMPIHLIFE